MLSQCSRLILVSVLYPLLSACESTTNSDSIKTSGMSAEFEVIADGSGSAEVVAKIRVGSGGIIGGTLVDLEGGDMLSASLDDDTELLDETRDAFNNPSYTANFDSDSGEFVIAFTRDEGVSAPNSRVTMPAGFSIDSPEPDAQLSSNQAINLNWSPSGYARNMALTYTFNCTANVPDNESLSGLGARSVPDVGAFSITPQDLHASMYEELQAGESCSMVITVERSLVGTVDSAFGEGGSIKGIQRRSIGFLLGDVD